VRQRERLVEALVRQAQDLEHLVGAQALAGKEHAVACDIEDIRRIWRGHAP
jgi:hypothetical protein